MQGRADDLSGAVFKKRLRRNRYRSVILTKAGTFWVYVYSFARQDWASLDEDELAGFRMLTEAYGSLTPKQVIRLLPDDAWMEMRSGVATRRKFKSDAFEAIHSSATTLHKAGAIDKDHLSFPCRQKP